MRHLNYTNRATIQLGQLLRYAIEESGSVDIGLALIHKLEGQCGKLARLPGTLGRPRPELGTDIRSSPLGDYVIFFRYLPYMLEVVSVMHAHRDVASYFDETERSRTSE